VYKDNIPPKIIKRIRQEYMTNEEFTPERIAKASSACEGLCRWVQAMDIYDRVAKVVAPKKEMLAVAEGEYETAMVGLRAKQAELKEVLDKLKMSQDKLAELTEKKEALTAQYEDCNNKLERAEKLMAGLGGEKVRWGEISASLGPKYTNLLGDVLLCSGVIAYLGPFTIPYRKEVVEEWQKGCVEKRIPSSEGLFDLQEIIGEGGCATVRRARWQGTMVAVKVLKTRFEAKDVYNEANLLAHLRHPCICALLGACELDVGLCLVLEYLEGGTLAQFLYPESSATCPTPYAAMVGASAPKGCLRRLQWSLDVADGLRYLHSRDVVHKDIKCSNVLLDATHTHAKVSDFGLSRSSEPVASMGSEEQSTTTSSPDSSLSACLRAESDSQYLPVPISRLSSMGSLRYLAPFTAPSDERHSSAVRFARDTCTSAGT